MNVAKPLLGGIAYFALVFALGFLFGTIRTLVVAHWPGIAMWQAVLVELPFLLGFSWWVCRRLIRTFGVVASIFSRLAMSVVALLFLFTTEAGVGAILTGRTVGDQVMTIFGTANLFGLLGQCAFGVFPLVQLWRSKSSVAPR